MALKTHNGEKSGMAVALNNGGSIVAAALSNIKASWRNVGDSSWRKWRHHQWHGAKWRS